VFGVVAEGRSVSVQLRPAYIHASDGEPGIDPGTGSLQDADLIIAGAALPLGCSGTPTRIVEGSVLCGGADFGNCLALPLRLEQRVRLSLVLADGSSFTIEGDGIAVETHGQPTFLENFG
jgi:hypothetical protein